VTEAEWLACTDPGTMLGFVRRRVSDRKLRCYLVACARRVLPPAPEISCLRLIKANPRRNGNSLR
jgi:hypothetical protein